VSDKLAGGIFATSLTLRKLNLWFDYLEMIVAHKSFTGKARKFRSFSKMLERKKITIRILLPENDGFEYWLDSMEKSSYI